MERFLKAKHWQIFLLSFGLPLVLYIIMMVNMVKNITSMSRGMGSEPDSLGMSGMFTVFPIMMLLVMGILYSWFWAIGVGLQKKVPENVKMKVMKFKIFFFYIIIYFTLFIIYFIYLTFSIRYGNFINPIYIFLILPFHLFGIFCTFYMLYFVAKTFKTVELQREVKFSDFAGEFFMIWFYPIGIWILQPKINKMIEEVE